MRAVRFISDLLKLSKFIQIPRYPGRRTVDMTELFGQVVLNTSTLWVRMVAIKQDIPQLETWELTVAPLLPHISGKMRGNQWGNDVMIRTNCISPMVVKSKLNNLQVEHCRTIATRLLRYQ